MFPHGFPFALILEILLPLFIFCLRGGKYRRGLLGSDDKIAKNDHHFTFKKNIFLDIIFNFQKEPCISENVDVLFSGGLR